MRQLIISSYDSEWEFTYVIIDNGLEVERGHKSKELKKYGLYNEEWSWFDFRMIDENNKSIQEFDMIIACEDGNVMVFINKNVIFSQK